MLIGSCSVTSIYFPLPIPNVTKVTYFPRSLLNTLLFATIPQKAALPPFGFKNVLGKN